MTQEKVNTIFEYAIAEHGDWIKNYMYMGTYDGQHHFKNIMTRRYVFIKEQE